VTPTLIESVVSNALVASVLAIFAFAVSRWRRPALAHGLWLLVLLKLVTPPLFPVNVSAILPGIPADCSSSNASRIDLEPIRMESLSPDELAVALLLVEQLPQAGPEPEAAAPAAAHQNSISWQAWLVPLWLGGSLVWLRLTARSVARFQRLLGSARQAPAALQSQAAELASRLGLARCPQVWLVPGAVSPMIWAVGTRPRLVFPCRLLDRLDRNQRAALLLHELAHVRRRDHWVRLIELIVAALYWWHPVVWWARRELREAEEQCCDAWVVWASGGEGRAYAQALLEAVAFVSRTRCPLPAAASGIGHIYHLRRRLTMIMQANTPRSLSALGWIVVLGIGLFLLPVAAQAQAPAKQRDEDRVREIKILKDKLRALEEKSAQRDQKLVLDEVADLDGAVVELVFDDGQTMEAIAQLKKQIAAKRAELRDLEAKLEKIVAGMEGKKAGKAKADAVKAKLKELKDVKGQIKIELIDEKAAKHFDEAIQKDLKNLKEHLNKVPKGAILLEQMDEKTMKQLREAIEKAIKANPDLKKLDELKKLGNLKEMIELKKLDELKKLGELKDMDLKNLDNIKKVIELKQFERAKALKGEAEKPGKMKTRKGDDIEQRLERLMKEIQELRQEIKESKGQKR
jgi:beta-lactamase regulating signal transducer with metallopeptidase domain